MLTGDDEDAPNALTHRDCCAVQPMKNPYEPRGQQTLDTYNAGLRRNEVGAASAKHLPVPRQCRW
jgi:hypothetical protein